ncbi:MAG TPA: orotidine-5'-phosphate decarboxylase [Acidimicrobiales bacterium]|nr:orotidine-5'-phosphate decarboxylase [Acidimicrobiales bacterium]
MNHFGTRTTGLMLAADLPSFEENARVLDAVKGDVDVIKVGTPLVLTEGIDVIRRFRDRFGKPVFADLKVADVPHTNAKLIRAAAGAGAAAVMVHGVIGFAGLKDAVAAAEGEVGIIVQVELTNEGGDRFTKDHAVDVIALGTLAGVYGFQAPGNRPERVREFREAAGDDAVLVCCGVGRQGGNFQEAVAAGGTYPIVGRAIYEADDPAAACAAILRPEVS